MSPLCHLQVSAAVACLLAHLKAIKRAVPEARPLYPAALRGGLAGIQCTHRLHCQPSHRRIERAVLVIADTSPRARTRSEAARAGGEGGTRRGGLGGWLARAVIHGLPIRRCRCNLPPVDTRALAVGAQHHACLVSLLGSARLPRLPAWESQFQPSWGRRHQLGKLVCGWCGAVLQPEPLEEAYVGGGDAAALKRSVAYPRVYQ
mmetsp:Transcript_73735/g.163890  ORF Transcript_73735/g.163890 Transcript_73735/m.163890 type:complete len:204 (-) Transcript_73735:41-652(-)